MRSSQNFGILKRYPRKDISPRMRGSVKYSTRIQPHGIRMESTQLGFHSKAIPILLDNPDHEQWPDFYKWKENWTEMKSSIGNIRTSWRSISDWVTWNLPTMKGEANIIHPIRQS